MKTIISKLFFISAVVMFLGSCKKDEVQQYFEGGTAPVLSASPSGTIPLSYATKDQTGVVLNWTNPGYQFVNCISSQDVTYTLEIDSTGKNFAGANKQTVSIAKDLGVTYTQDQFNIILSGLKLAVGGTYSIDVRVSSTINNVLATKLTSNTLTFKVTPYNPPPKVQVPSAGVLYLVGSATAAAWSNPVPTPSQQFTQLSPTLYTITIPLSAGGAYDFLPINGSWAQKYCVNDATIAGLSAGGSFVYLTSGGSDIPGPSVAGNYKIVVDFQAGTFTATKQ